jgi:alpha-glucosidase (family GH31 glycosyl hydrolase)
VRWWHGHGSFLDYTFPEAVEWWNAQLDIPLVTTGVDGFKCDGTDPYLLELDVFDGGARGHDGKLIHYRDYADRYYGGFFNHSRTRNPDALIMARPVDSYNTDLYWHFAPRYVSFSGWVGDQDPDFTGFVRIDCFELK